MEKKRLKDEKLERECPEVHSDFYFDIFDMTLVNRTHVVSMSELDGFGVEFYEKALIAAKVTSPIKKKVESKNNSGFIDKIEPFRTKLEDLFKNSPDTKQ